MIKERQIQRFSLDGQGKLVDIENISDKSGPFFCPNCHDVIIARTGKIRAWHFAHKTQICSYESYLHSLAKIRIAEWFSKSESIILDMDSCGICTYHESCTIYDINTCTNSTRSQYDLKKYYSVCETERAYGAFIPDILCYHDSVPLFIEICVNHECSEEKKSSGHLIIEICIDSEEAIDKIISSSILAESENTRLYGFKRAKIPCDDIRRPLTKYTLYQSGKSYVSYGNIDCLNFQFRRPSAIYELTTSKALDPVSMYLVGKSMAHKDGVLPKDCSICLWLGGTIESRICKLYKKCGNPMWCEDNDAKKCPMFRENVELIEEFISIYEKSRQYYDVWRQDLSAVP